MVDYKSTHTGTQLDTATTTVLNDDSKVKYGNIIGDLEDQEDLYLALSAKEDVITDLQEIREGAALGATSLQGSDIINTVASTSTDKALSANMGKSLQDEIDALKARGKFLSTWAANTGRPGTEPPGLNAGERYNYTTGDYFIVSSVASGSGTNYKPNGTYYIVGSTSSTVETGTVAVNDTYYFSGSEWSLLHGAEIVTTFASIAGQPTDNTNLATALNGKVPTTRKVNGQALTQDITIDALPSQTGEAGKFLTTNGSVASWQEIPTEVDNASISLNSDDELQAIGVIDNNSNAIKTWTGTRAEYNALTTKDPNTLYNVKGDDQTVVFDAYTKAQTDTLVNSSISTAISTLLSAVYPVGKLYITTDSTCPLATLITGSTWVLVGQDKVLQGAGTRGAVGTTINESLPNIKGNLNAWNDVGSFSRTQSGVFTASNFNSRFPASATSGDCALQVNFNANNSSSTYQDNAPVQPDAFLVNIFRRTA